MRHALDITPAQYCNAIIIYFRTPDHAESPQRGRDRKERDVTPVYDSRTGIPASSGASGKTYVWSSNYNYFAISLYASLVYALTVKYTLGSSNYQSSSSHGNSSTNMGTERGELLWDRERERIKKKEKEKEIAAKMAVRLILKLKPCSVLKRLMLSLSITFVFL